jgi:uncharacterized protein
MGILSSEMQRVVREQRLGFVATVCPDGTPNLSPKGTLTVWDDEHLVFVDLRSPGTIANLRTNPAVEVNVVDPLLRKGWRFKGTAEVVRAGPLYERIRSMYLSDVRLAEEAAQRLPAFVLVRVARALPLISPAYDRWTESQVLARWKAHHAGLHPE